MKSLVLWISVVLAAVLMAGCQAAPTATPVPSPTVTVVEEAVLKVVGIDGTTKSLTMTDLESLPVKEGWAGQKSSTGRISPPRKIKGVALTDLCALVSELGPGMGVSVQAKDGYAMTVSYDQIAEGSFVTYDPGTGKEIVVDDPLQVILAYEADGAPLDATKEGPLRMVVIGPSENQVTDGHWSVKWVNHVEVKSLAEDWVLHLEGAITEEMDRGTFESGAVANCHQTTWTDDKARVWTGIPLWLLVGRVDDENPHQDDAFNRDLADAGYTVEVIAADGYKVSFDSGRVKENDDIIVAYLMSDNPLDEKHFPLRLVGSALEKAEMVGQIAEIRVDLTGKVEPTLEPTATPIPEPTATTSAEQGLGDLAITGAVANSLVLTETDLRGMDVTKIAAEHPKKGQQEYEGVRLNALLDQAQLGDDATKAVFTADDGYAAEVSLKDLRACEDCLVAFTETPGKLRIVLPGFESDVWIKGVVSIEIK